MAQQKKSTWEKIIDTAGALPRAQYEAIFPEGWGQDLFDDIAESMLDYINQPPKSFESFNGVQIDLSDFTGVDGEETFALDNLNVDQIQTIFDKGGQYDDKWIREGYRDISTGLLQVNALLNALPDYLETLGTGTGTGTTTDLSGFLTSNDLANYISTDSDWKTLGSNWETLGDMLDPEYDWMADVDLKPDIKTALESLGYKGALSNEILLKNDVKTEFDSYIKDSRQTLIDTLTGEENSTFHNLSKKQINKIIGDYDITAHTKWEDIVQENIAFTSQTGAANALFYSDNETELESRYKTLLDNDELSPEMQSIITAAYEGAKARLDKNAAQSQDITDLQTKDQYYESIQSSILDSFGIDTDGLYGKDEYGNEFDFQDLWQAALTAGGLEGENIIDVFSGISSDVYDLDETVTEQGTTIYGDENLPGDEGIVGQTQDVGEDLATLQDDIFGEDGIRDLITNLVPLEDYNTAILGLQGAIDRTERRSLINEQRARTTASYGSMGSTVNNRARNVRPVQSLNIGTGNNQWTRSNINKRNSRTASSVNIN